MNIFSLTYVSSASGLYDTDTYRNIALHSQAFNGARSITGMLLIYNETIIQFLEGPEVEVSALYRRIEVDNRHQSPILISTRQRDAREFPDWSMGYQEVSKLTDPKYIFSLNQQTLGLHFPAHISGATEALKSSFTRSSGLIAA